MAGQGFDLALHPADSSSEFVALFGELVRSGLGLFASQALKVEKFVQSADSADTGVVHGAVGRFPGEEFPQLQEAIQQDCARNP